MTATVTEFRRVSRAVLLRASPAIGTAGLCAGCGDWRWVGAQGRGWIVVANVYENGVWVRLLRYHPRCYEQAGRPYGEPDNRRGPRRG